MEETGRSDYRIERTEGAILYPAYPHHFQKKTREIRRK